MLYLKNLIEESTKEEGKIAYYVARWWDTYHISAYPTGRNKSFGWLRLLWLQGLYIGWQSRMTGIGYFLLLSISFIRAIGSGRGRYEKRKHKR